MIKADITAGSGCLAARLKGHAGYAPKGSDIVCAGVSALSAALLESASVVVTKENTAYFSAQVSDGSFEIRALGIRSGETEKRLRDMFFMFSTGLERIEQQYPDYIKLNMFEFPEGGNDNGTSEQTMITKREEDKG